MASNRPRPPALSNDGKLDGTNYPLWKFKMMAILSSYELWDTATGLDKQPEASVDASGNTVPPSPTAVQEWKQRNADALYAIVIKVQDSMLMMVQHVTKALEAWELLRNQYETTNPTRVLNLENQLQSERLAEGEVVNVFLTRIKGLRDQMAVIGLALKSEDLA